MNKRLGLSLVISVSLISVTYSADRQGSANIPGLGEKAKPTGDIIQRSKQLLERLRSGADMATLHAFLDAGVDINYQDDEGNTALMIAVNNNFFIAQKLLDKDANINLQNKKGDTALMIALSNGFSSGTIARQLLEMGANVNLQNTKGDTALMIASRDTEWKLRAANATMSVIPHYGIIVRTLLIKGANVNMQNDQGDTALIIAARCGNLEMIEILFDNGRANVEYRAALAKNRVKVEVNVDLQNARGQTALIIASQKGYTEIVKILLESGADVTLKDNTGHTALRYAVDQGFTKIAEMML